MDLKKILISMWITIDGTFIYHDGCLTIGTEVSTILS